MRAVSFGSAHHAACRQNLRPGVATKRLRHWQSRPAVAMVGLLADAASAKQYVRPAPRIGANRPPRIRCGTLLTLTRAGSVEKAKAPGAGGGSDPVVDVKLGKDVREVRVHGLGADDQPRGDCLVGESVVE